MKKIFISAFIFFMSMNAFACNINTQNCAELWNPSIQRYSAMLKANPVFMNEGLESYKKEYQRYSQRWDNCTTIRCQNHATNDWHDYLLKIMMEYDSKLKHQTKTTAIKDKWADQCVIGKNMKVLVYKDVDGTQAIGELGNDAYSVSHTNGGKLVGLKTVPDYTQSNPDANAGKFIGWVKKANLDMQDLRNCN